MRMIIKTANMSVLTKLQKEAEVHISKQQRRSLGYWEPSIFLIGHVN